MKNKLKFLFAIFFILLIGVFICFRADGIVNRTNKPRYQAEEIIREGRTIEETNYYKIMESNFLYCCVFYNRQHVVTKIEGPMEKEPRVGMVDEKFVRFTVQAGTGTGAQWGYYYDPGMDVFSDVFESILDESDGKVAYSRQNAIVIRDIFDESKYFKEITEFENTLSPTVEPFMDVRFTDDGKYVEVTYLTGEDYRETTERFAL